jgi:hypothetical protein
MVVVAPNGHKDFYHFLQLYRKVEGENSWPEFFVLYRDSNLRIIPHPPQGRSSVCFGSSVMVGPGSEQDDIPEIAEARVTFSPLVVEVRYTQGGTARINLSVNRSQAVADVTVGYTTTKDVRFAQLRSMFITETNADVAWVETPSETYQILQGWVTLNASWWYFHRQIRSIHNVSAPNIKIEILE